MIDTKRRTTATVLALTLLTLLLVACQPQDPVERVQAMRANYVAELNGWIVREPPAPEPPMEAEPFEAADDAAEADEGEADEMDEMPVADLERPEPTGPAIRDILLDIDIYHTNAEMLPGITVDVTHADTTQKEKGTYRVYLDTSGIVKGQHVQVNHVLEELVFEVGDLFAVEVRYPIPEAEFGDYRELSEIQ